MHGRGDGERGERGEELREEDGWGIVEAGFGGKTLRVTSTEAKPTRILQAEYVQ